MSLKFNISSDMPDLFSEYPLKIFTIKNRIVFPPVVCFHYSGDDGIVNERNIAHYTARAEGGPGIIVTEATAVWKDGRLAPFQLGIWSDEHIPGLSRIAETVKKNGVLSLIQIHHAGLITPPSVSGSPAGPSPDEKKPGSRSLSVDEIRIIRDAFITGALRAKKAGFDGIELHGAHGYLLNQFASSFFNKREDEYGGDLYGRLKLATEIIRGIRAVCGEDFIIDYRLGANTPTLEDGIEVAKYLESLGVDILHLSHGGSLQNLPRTPKDFEFNWIVYSGTVIKTHVKIPVIAVNEIKTPERASKLIEKGLTDFVALARPQMADPSWANHVKNNEPINLCLSCKPKCRWYEDSNLCPAVIKLASSRAGELMS
ncbi:MAG: NADH:flavin oxidoreductase [Bacteroidetes bacterium]|nr:NADH:flavin oxidoreductase [Bacteroidota bacterium]